MRAGSLVLRAVVALGPLVALGCGAVEADPPPGWVWAVVAAFALRHAQRPGSLAGALGISTVVVWWAITVGVPTSAGGLQSVVGAVAALTATHVAGLLTEVGPAQVHLEAGLLARWSWRGGLLVATGVMTAAGATAAATNLEDVAASTVLWPAAVGALGLALMATTLVVRADSRTSRSVSENAGAPR